MIILIREANVNGGLTVVLPRTPQSQHQSGSRTSVFPVMKVERKVLYINSDCNIPSEGTGYTIEYRLRSICSECTIEIIR